MSGTEQQGPDQPDARARHWRRVRAALVFSFLLVFVFAAVLELTAQFVGWVTSTRVDFLFPLGLDTVLSNVVHFINVVLGLSLVALVFAVVLYWRMWSVEERAWGSKWLRDLERGDNGND